MTSITLMKNSSNVLIETLTPIGTPHRVVTPIMEISAIQQRSGALTVFCIIANNLVLNNMKIFLLLANNYFESLKYWFLLRFYKKFSFAIIYFSFYEKHIFASFFLKLFFFKAFLIYLLTWGS